MMLLTYQKKPKRSPDLANMSCLRKWCIIITEKKAFEYAILISILINTVLLGSYHFMMDEYWEGTINFFNSFFISVFAIEAIMKIIAQKLDYFKDHWNQFDFIVLIITLSMLIPLSLGHGNDFQQLVSVIRVIRVCRIFKVVVRAKKIVVIYRTLVDTLPVLSSFGILLVILLFMFTVVSVQLFAMVDLNPIDGLERQMGEHANFRDFWSAFFTLFRCSSGEAWNNIMFETSWEPNVLF